MNEAFEDLSDVDIEDSSDDISVDDDGPENVFLSMIKSELANSQDRKQKTNTKRVPWVRK